MANGDASNPPATWSAYAKEKLWMALSDPNRINAIAGSGAGLIAAVFVCPLDVIKTRVQVQRIVPGMPPKYNGMFGSAAVILREEGIRGMYTGLSPTLVALLPNWAIYFTAYKAIKHKLNDSMRHRESDFKMPSTGINVLAASGAGFATVIATNPLWVVKTRIMTSSMRNDMRQYTGTFSTLYRIMREERMSGLYSGLVPAMVGVSHVMIQFPAYEWLKGTFAENAQMDVKELDPKLLALASGLSKIVASTITYPHEIIRARLQEQVRERGVRPLYSGTLDCARQLIAEGGIRTLYRGCALNLARTVPAAAVTFTSFEMLGRALHRMAKLAAEAREAEASMAQSTEGGAAVGKVAQVGGGKEAAAAPVEPPHGVRGHIIKEEAGS